MINKMERKKNRYYIYIYIYIYIYVCVCVCVCVCMYNELRAETDRTNDICMEEICDLQRKGR